MIPIHVRGLIPEWPVQCGVRSDIRARVGPCELNAIHKQIVPLTLPIIRMADTYIFIS